MVIACQKLYFIISFVKILVNLVHSAETNMAHAYQNIAYNLMSK